MADAKKASHQRPKSELQHQGKFKCQNCGGPLDTIASDKKHSYCPKCGHTINWLEAAKS